MIFREKDDVLFQERGTRAEDAEAGVVIGIVQALPKLYIVRIPYGHDRFRFVIADEKELKIRRK